MFDNTPFGVVLLVLISLLSIVVYLIHRNPKTDFRVEDFLRDENGKPSWARGSGTIALIGSTYVIVYMAFRGTLTDIVFGLYLAAWVTPDVMRNVKEMRQVKGDTNAPG